jgi:hypothetical protein
LFFKIKLIADTDENGTILDQTEEETPQQPENTEARFESLSREATPKVKGTINQNQSDGGTRKRTRSQTSIQDEPPAQKKGR